MATGTKTPAKKTTAPKKTTPPAKKTPPGPRDNVRTIRCAPSLWDPFVAKCERQGRGAAEVLRAYMIEYLGPEAPK